MNLYEIYEDENKYYIVIELLSGKHLSDYVTSKPNKKLNESEATVIMKHILSGLNCCHMQNIVHRDIKLENIMFSDPERTNIKLIDFGFGKLCREGKSQLREQLGSPMYMAPEIFIQSQYNEKCDIWSCGILCYILLSGKAPYIINGNTAKVASIDTLYNLIKTKEFTDEDFSGPEWSQVSSKAKDFVLTLLQRNPMKRPSASKALEHSWLNSIQNKQKDIGESHGVMKRLMTKKVM